MTCLMLCMAFHSCVMQREMSRFGEFLPKKNLLQELRQELCVSLGIQTNLYQRVSHKSYSEHPSSTVKLTYVEKKPFNFELETVEDPYWNLYLRSSTGLKLLSSYSRSGIER